MRGHFNISIEWLEQFIRERGNDGLILDGTRSVSRTAALKFLTHQRASGIKYVSPHCPSPRPDGSCPTHQTDE